MKGAEEDYRDVPAEEMDPPVSSPFAVKQKYCRTLFAFTHCVSFKSTSGEFLLIFTSTYLHGQSEAGIKCERGRADNTDWPSGSI